MNSHKYFATRNDLKLILGNPLVESQNRHSCIHCSQAVSIFAVKVSFYLKVYEYSLVSYDK